MSKTREEEQAVKIVNTFWNFNGSRSALTDEILKALQQARRNGAREELMYLKEQYGQYTYLTWFTIDERLAALEQPPTKEER